MSLVTGQPFHYVHHAETPGVGRQSIQNDAEHDRADERHEQISPRAQTVKALGVLSARKPGGAFQGCPKEQDHEPGEKACHDCERGQRRQGFDAGQLAAQEVQRRARAGETG